MENFGNLVNLEILNVDVRNELLCSPASFTKLVNLEVSDFVGVRFGTTHLTSIYC